MKRLWRNLTTKQAYALIADGKVLLVRSTRDGLPWHRCLHMLRTGVIGDIVPVRIPRWMKVR